MVICLELLSECAKKKRKDFEANGEAENRESRQITGFFSAHGRSSFNSADHFLRNDVPKIDGSKVVSVHCL